MTKDGNIFLNEVKCVGRPRRICQWYACSFIKINNIRGMYRPSLLKTLAQKKREKKRKLGL
jgi:hypothetical protein